MSTIQSNHKFQNWDRTLGCMPRRYFQPSSESEVCELVREISHARETLRVVGAGHSWSPLVVTEGNLMNLDHLNQLYSTDADKLQVTVGAGIRLKDLNDLLAQQGLALANIGSVAEQSLRQLP
jgi:FAD/FMN-containing dehydrogenase